MNSLLLVSTILSLSLSGLVIQPDSKKQETLNTLLNAEAVLVKEKEIYFSNSIGYLEEYKDESNNTSTIFYLNSTSLDDLVSVYHDKSISEITNNDTLKNDLIAFSNKKHSIIDDANTVTLRSKAPNVNYDFNAEKFFSCVCIRSCHQSNKSLCLIFLYQQCSKLHEHSIQEQWMRSNRNGNVFGLHST